MQLPNHRIINSLQAIAGIFLILVAVFYFQNHLQLEPCYLCIIQRVFVIAIAVVCALAVLHNPHIWAENLRWYINTAGFYW